MNANILLDSASTPQHAARPMQADANLRDLPTRGANAAAPTVVDLPQRPAAPLRLSAGQGLPLRARPMGHGDLNEARSMLPGWLKMDAEVRSALPVLWTRLLGQSGFAADLIEDLSRPIGKRIVGLGVTVTLDPVWQQRMRTTPPSHAGAAWYRDFMDARASIPDDRSLARANLAGDIGMLVLHYAQEATDPRSALVQQVLLTAMKQFRHAHGGWHLRDVWQEASGEGGEYLEGMGFRRRTVRGEGQPDLHGLSRDEAARGFPGTPAHDVFHFVPPILGFSGSERRMLRLAVAELTDEEIADEVGLTLHTLKKLWRSSCERAADALPELFDAAAEATPGIRGQEKRRHLLQYLRQHPEELRPYG